MCASLPTPVADAAMRGDVETVRKLIKQGASVNAAQGDGMTALHWAAERGDAALTDALLAAHANVKAVTRIGAYTPLHIAAKSGNAAVVDGAAQGRRRRQRVDEHRRHGAALRRRGGQRRASSTALLEHGATPTRANPSGDRRRSSSRPSTIAPTAIRALLKRGADPSIHTTW